MKDLILLPGDEEIFDPNGSVSISIPLSAIDPFHPDVQGFLRNEVLKQRHHARFIQDGLNTGHFSLVRGRYSTPSYKFNSKLPFPTFAGFVFEAFTVRVLNSIPAGKRRAIAWASKRKNVGDEFANKFKAIGVGLFDTKRDHPPFYAPQDALDVKFIRERYNKLSREYFLDILEIMGTHLSAGIQVKAITGNEKSEIIDPLISGKYARVLTYLRHSDGEHSYDSCMRILSDMYKAGFIGAEERLRIADSIETPRIVGVDQREVDEYYKYIQIAYKGVTETPYPDLFNVANLEISFFKNQSGILVPDSLGEYPETSNGE